MNAPTLTWTVEAKGSRSEIRLCGSVKIKGDLRLGSSRSTRINGVAEKVGAESSFPESSSS